MLIELFAVTGLGFPRSKSSKLISLHEELAAYLADKTYSDEILRLGGAYAVERLAEQRFFPRPYVSKAKFIQAKNLPSWPRDWPDQHIPISLNVKYYVDYETAAIAEGSILRHALVDPLCEAIKQTPKTLQRRIDTARLIADLQNWADIP
jgi:hypothetical protein